MRGDFKHLCAEIQPVGFRAAAREGERNIARAAAKIERTVAIFYLRQLDDAPFPQPVQAETLQVVQKIVAARDAGEEVVDLRGTLVAGRVIDIAHTDSLATATCMAKPRNVFAPDRRFVRFGAKFQRIL